MTSVTSKSRKLAALLLALVLSSIAPALVELNLVAAPDWARLLLLSGSLVVVYVVWMALAPCRETLRTITWVLAIAAAAAALAVGVVLFSEPNRPLPLEITASRAFAVTWCAIIATLLSIGSVVAGRVAARGAKIDSKRSS